MATLLDTLSLETVEDPTGHGADTVGIVHTDPATGTKVYMGLAAGIHNTAGIRGVHYNPSPSDKVAAVYEKAGNGRVTIVEA